MAKRFLIHKIGHAVGTAQFDGTGLKGYWKFNEASGTLANTASSVLNSSPVASSNGTGTSITYSQSVILSEGIKLNGVANQGRVVFGSTGGNANWNFFHNTTAKWSIVIWYKSTSATAGAFESVLSDWNGSGGTNGFRISRRTNNTLVVEIYNTSNQVILSYTSGSNAFPNDTSVHMLYISYDQSLGSNNLSWSVDNGAITNASKTVNTPSASNPPYTPTVGQDTDAGSGSDGAWNASCAELSIWNRILTSGQLTNLYNGGLGLSLW